MVQKSQTATGWNVYRLATSIGERRISEASTVCLPAFTIKNQAKKPNLQQKETETNISHCIFLGSFHNGWLVSSRLR